MVSSLRIKMPIPMGTRFIWIVWKCASSRRLTRSLNSTNSHPIATTWLTNKADRMPLMRSFNGLWAQIMATSKMFQSTSSLCSCKRNWTSKQKKFPRPSKRTINSWPSSCHHPLTEFQDLTLQWIYRTLIIVIF